jgi:hypothetical protein
MVWGQLAARGVEESDVPGWCWCSPRRSQTIYIGGALKYFLAS